MITKANEIVASTLADLRAAEQILKPLIRRHPPADWSRWQQILHDHRTVTDRFDAQLRTLGIFVRLQKGREAQAVMNDINTARGHMQRDLAALREVNDLEAAYNAE